MNDAEVRLQVIIDDKKSTQKLNNDVKNTTSSTDKLKSTGKAVGSAFLKGATIAGGALTAMIGASIKGYADLEQSIGGVETLFKDSADTVIANSKKAYETAGMDANTYMETITSFSAKLLQGLGGDTEQASKIANQAVIDMSDNANKMGTDIQSIVETYQSLARGNYEMLDNLKLGYGGTQTEMARLINESGVLGDTMVATAENVNQIPFDKVLEAIHKIQENMGITGTTAKEASTTITGSFNAAKSAFQNFLSGAGGVDEVVETFTTFGTNVSKALVKMAPKITKGLVELINSLVPQIPKLIKQLLPVLAEGVVGLLQGLIEMMPDLLVVLAELLPTIIETLINGFITIANSIAEQLPTIIPIIIDALMQGILSLMTNAPELLECATQLILGLSQGLINSIPILISYLPQILQSLITYILSYTPQMLSMGIKLISSLAIGLVKAIPQLVAKIPQIVSAIFNGLKNGLSNIGDIGKNLIKGLWNGINDMVGWIGKKIKGFGKSVLNKLKDFFGIHSPSKVMFEIGGYLDKGFINGIEDMQKDVDKQVVTTFGSGLDYLYNGFDNISSAYSQPVNMNYANNPILNVNIQADMDVNKFGKAFVNNVKTFSGGAKNSYNYGGAR